MQRAAQREHGSACCLAGGLPSSATLQSHHHIDDYDSIDALTRIEPGGRTTYLGAQFTGAGARERPRFRAVRTAASLLAARPCAPKFNSEIGNADQLDDLRSGE